MASSGCQVHRGSRAHPIENSFILQNTKIIHLSTRRLFGEDTSHQIWTNAPTISPVIASPPIISPNHVSHGNSPAATRKCHSKLQMIRLFTLLCSPRREALI